MRLISKLCNFAFLAFVLVAAGGRAFSQNSLDAYTSAVRQSRIIDRMAGMERYLATYPSSGLRPDALEILVWDSMESGQRDKARARAADLRQLDPQNALALAVLSQERAEAAGNKDRKGAHDAFDMARQGIQSYPKLRHPEGMRDGEFIQLQRQVVSLLDGEAGLGYLAQKDYASAATYLRACVGIRPGDPRYLYGLSIALLDSKDASQQQEGYLYLARVVNLTNGTAGGQQIASYAQERFQKAGGSTGDWDQYLASAVVPGTRGRATAQQQPTVVASALAKTSPAPAAKTSTSTTTVAKTQPPAPKKQPAPTTIAKATPPSTPQYDTMPPESIPEPTFRREYVARTSPVSMGILLQTEHLTKENRQEILAALTDMVRHLRNDDEVFIMAYGKKLDFEQDLTGNPRLLEEAMDQIKAESGTALLDAVGFAAGHLERIATNKNRLLLVISDGRNTPSKDNPLTLSQKLNTVRVDCIGLQVDGDSGRRQLESLAAYSGGQVTFASSTAQLRTAAVQMAEGIGIEFPN